MFQGGDETVQEREYRIISRLYDYNTFPGQQRVSVLIDTGAGR